MPTIAVSLKYELGVRQVYVQIQTRVLNLRVVCEVLTTWFPYKNEYNNNCSLYI